MLIGQNKPARQGGLQLGAMIASLVLATACTPETASTETAAPAAPAAPGLPQLHVTLAPGGLDTAGETDQAWIDVTLQISGLDITAHTPFLTSPAIFAGVEAVAYGEDGIGDVIVTDEAGPVGLVRADDDPDPTNFLYWRHWQAERDLEGLVTVTYRAPIDLVIPQLGAGPPFDLRLNGEIVSGAGNTFLVVPATPRPFMVNLDWDLSAMPDGSIGASSFGEGQVLTPGPASRLVTAYYMAGPMGHYPAEAGDHAYRAYWTDNPPFDPDTVMPWAEEVYDAQLDFFGIENPEPYTFFARANPYPGGGGAGLINSFMLSYRHDTEELDGINITIIHEMSHKWVGGVSGQPGGNAWFTEGANVFFTRRVPLSAGLMTEEQYLADVNQHAARYYTNAVNDLPNDQIPGLFWSDTRVRTLPYDRGSLYFATVDAQVRAASAGERSMNDLFFQLDALRQAGETVTAETWADIVAGELGEPARADFWAMMDGALQIPPADAYGPCFDRVSTDSRVFELGFDAASLVSEPRLVSGLIAGSNAEQAGLRDGDEILQSVALEGVQSDDTRTLSLRVRRDGRDFTVDYLPRGEAVTVYTWELVPGPDDRSCAL
ncbi:hypothetical protein [Maricaulis parjimensis]|uniref:hypothetical protein n=1 Tax=Maricaulis parjimensis TaxID=144023 RepID=UPI00193A68AE|nr:hypothetical protein [Maricaulis parjimensis]